jgi:hypothetical protein
VDVQVHRRGAEVRFRCSQRRYHDHVSMYIYTPASSLCGCASTTQSFAPNGLPGSCPRPLPGYAVYPGVPTLYPADSTVPGLYPATGQGYAWVQRGTPRVPGHFRVKAGYNWVRTGNSPGNGGKIHSVWMRMQACKGGWGWGGVWPPATCTNLLHHTW